MTWQGALDENALLAHADGPGIPWLPGRGNALGGPQPADVPEVLEAKARAFLAANAPLLALDGFTLQRNQQRTRALGAPPTMWLLVFDLLLEGLRVQDAEVRFVVSHGNLVSVLRDAPRAPRTSEAAPSQATVATIPPSRVELREGRVLVDPRWGEVTLALHFDGARFVRVWEGIVTDRPTGDPFEVVIEIASGAVLRETPLRVPGQVVGGVPLRSSTEPETMMPLANLEIGSGGNTAVTDAAGRFDLAGAVSGDLSGLFVRVVDRCGPISVAAVGDVLDFGATAAGDCASAVEDAPGDTRAARTSTYHLNRMRDLYKALDPATPWLETPIDVITNHPVECSNYYDASTDAIVLNWHAGSSRCANAGENPSLLYHEWAHGYQWNQKGFFGDVATREGYADASSFLQLPSACLFEGFFLGDDTHGCAGGRTLDYTRLSPAIPARPDTIGAPPYSCPVVSPGSGGIADYQGHCEAAILTQAVHDLALAFQARYGVATGMRRLLEMWIAAGPMQLNGWRVVDPGPPLRGDGCDPRSWYQTLRTANDDNGNLLDGVPDESLLFDAFDRHGIACGAREDLPPDHATCPALAAPAASLAYDAERDGVQLAWLPVDGATAYRVARSELGPEGPFTPIATVAADQLEHFDADGTARALHWYVVSALDAGSCASAIDGVLPSTTCATPATLIDAIVEGANVTLAWTLVANATEHEVSLGLPGALRSLGTTADSQLALPPSYLEPGVTYHWRVATRAADEACPIEESATRSLTLAGEPAPPTVSAVVPDGGSTAGGTEVRIQGTNLHLGARVFFGSTAATVLGHESSGEIVVRAPAGSPGAVNVRVVNPSGAETTWTGFAYLVGEVDVPLLQNGGVEKLTAVGLTPPGWTRAGKFRPALHCSDGTSRYVHGGACSVRFRGEVTPSGGRARGTLTQTVEVAPEPRPERLHVRFHARAKNVPPNGRARVFVDVLAAGVLAERFVVPLDPGSYAFRAYEATFEPGAAYDAVSVRILYKASSGRLWVDDLSLEFAE